MHIPSALVGAASAVVLLAIVGTIAAQYLRANPGSDIAARLTIIGIAAHGLLRNETVRKLIPPPIRAVFESIPEIDASGLARVRAAEPVKAGEPVAVLRGVAAADAAPGQVVPVRPTPPEGTAAISRSVRPPIPRLPLFLLALAVAVSLLSGCTNTAILRGAEDVMWRRGVAASAKLKAQCSDGYESATTYRETSRLDVMGCPQAAAAHVVYVAAHKTLKATITLIETGKCSNISHTPRECDYGAALQAVEEATASLVAAVSTLEGS